MPKHTWTFDAIGTAWSVETDDPLDEVARFDVSSVIEEFDKAWSRFRADSLVTALAKGAGVVDAPAGASDIFEVYLDLSARTGGAVNPLIGRSLETLGYDASLSLKPSGRAHPAPRDWRERLAWTRESLALHDAELIDIGAVGKGRLVDLVTATVRPYVKGAIVVDASGDVFVSGTKERIALEHPYDTSRAIGAIDVADEALCASAGNRRAWGDGLHHVLDARTGQPVLTVVATWAVAPTTMEADAAATALFFEGGPEFAANRCRDWVRMLSDGRVEYSPGSSAELFT